MNRLIAPNVGLALPAEAFDKYRGQWIALSPDDSRILASDDDLGRLEDKLIAAGESPDQGNRSRPVLVNALIWSSRGSCNRGHVLHVRSVDAADRSARRVVGRGSGLAVGDRGGEGSAD